MISLHLILNKLNEEDRQSSNSIYFQKKPAEFSHQRLKVLFKPYTGSRTYDRDIPN